VNSVGDLRRLISFRITTKHNHGDYSGDHGARLLPTNVLHKVSTRNSRLHAGD
jgi:hypothetical protein